MNKVNVPQLRFKGFEGEWEEKSIEDLCAMQAGKFISASKIKENNSEDLFPCYGGNGLRGYTESFNYDGNYSLIGRQGALCGNITFVNNKFHATEHAIVVKVNKNIDNNWMYYILNILNLNQYATGQAQPGLSVQNIKKVEVTITNSIAEQQKIASFLSAVDEKIQQLSRKKELLEQYKKGVMQQLFSGKLRFKDEDGNDYANWEEKKLGDVAKFRRGSFPQPYGLPKWYDDENGIPFIQVYDVDHNMLLKKTTKNKISKLGAEQSVFVKKGTLVITIQGSIGRIAKTQYDAYIDRTLLIFQSYKLPTDVDYFKYVVFLLFEIEKTKAPGGTIKTITKEVLTDFIVPIPCLKEQQKIANFLSSIDAKIESVNQQITQTQSFKKGLLQQLFV
jgi:type I restriction enzyme S subunit